MTRSYVGAFRRLNLCQLRRQLRQLQRQIVDRSFCLVCSPSRLFLALLYLGLEVVTVTFDKLARPLL